MAGTSAEGQALAPLCPHVREVTAVRLRVCTSSRAASCPELRLPRHPCLPRPASSTCRRYARGCRLSPPEVSRSWERYGRSRLGWGKPALPPPPLPQPTLRGRPPHPTSPQCQPPGTASLKPGVVFSPLLGPSGSQNSCLDKSATRYMPKLDVSTPSSLHTQIRFPQALAAVLPTHVTNGFRSW